MPLAAYGLSAVSAAAGPIGRIGAGIALQTVTSPGASNRVATFLAGPKGVTRPEPAGAGEGPARAAGDGSGWRGCPAWTAAPGAAPANNPPGQRSRCAAGPVLGLVDDVAIPSMRYLGPLISSLSPQVKAAAGIAAGAYGAYEYLKSTADFRGQPAPPPEIRPDNKPDSKPSLSSKTPDNRPTPAWKPLKIKSNKIKGARQTRDKPV